MSRRDSTPLYKLIVLGDGGVGKTALTIQLCLNQFVETYDPTIEDMYRKQVKLDGQVALLEVLDTAGQEEYTSLRDQWIRDGEGFILVYSITSRPSFNRIKQYSSQIQRVKEEEDQYAVVLVGNKSDCSKEREVTKQEGEEMAKHLGNVTFFEASAKLDENIEAVFFACARKCRQLREPGAKDMVDSAVPVSNSDSAGLGMQTPRTTHFSKDSRLSKSTKQSSYSFREKKSSIEPQVSPHSGASKKSRRKRACVIM